MRASLLLLLLFSALALAEEEPRRGIYDPAQGYFSLEPHDRFSRLKAELETGRKTLDTRGELPFLRSVLAALEVPVSSQTLVYSVTSLQKGLISPRRPRALYFNEDTYVGFVPDGRVEVISTDPQIGNVFYIFDRVTEGVPPRVVRSGECMNCHAPHYLQEIPALVLQSVIPAMTGGGERAFRREQIGHGVPLDLRFGGWHVTGAGPGFPKNWGNMIIERRDGVAHELANPPGALFDLKRFPVPTSDVLAHLLQEHQAGFVDCALQAAYAAREAAGSRGLEELARPVVRYLLFADEAALTPGSVPGDAAFRADFLARRKAAKDGKSLRDLDLSTRLFRYRCSYMIYSPAFTGLPGPLKQEVFRQMRVALGENAVGEYAFLGAEEKRSIRRILAETLPGFAG